jgi:hypothetical protein
METPHRSTAGGRVEQCSDDAGCTVLSCAVCLKEVPPDAVSLTDVRDYVHHFCGLDCLEEWRRRAGLPGTDRLK